MGYNVSARRSSVDSRARHKVPTPFTTLSPSSEGARPRALPLLYHLATLGSEANELPGVSELLHEARVDSVPNADLAHPNGQRWTKSAGQGGCVGPSGPRRIEADAR